MEVKVYQGLIELNWNFLFSLITVVVLIFILKHFFFEKVHNFMMERQKTVETQLSDAKKKNLEAEALLGDYKKTLADADFEGRAIVKEAKTNASKQADEIIEEARKKAEVIVEKAEKRAEREQERAMKDIKGQVAELAVMAAGKIIEKELDTSGKDDIIDKAIEEVGKGKWKE